MDSILASNPANAIGSLKTALDTGTDVPDKAAATVLLKKLEQK